MHECSDIIIVLVCIDRAQVLMIHSVLLFFPFSAMLQSQWEKKGILRTPTRDVPLPRATDSE